MRRRARVARGVGIAAQNAGTRTATTAAATMRDRLERGTATGDIVTAGAPASINLRRR